MSEQPIGREDLVGSWGKGKRKEIYEGTNIVTAKDRRVPSRIGNEKKGNFYDREEAGIVKAVAKSPVATEPTKEPPAALTSH
jgi:hypothetical protein